MKSIFTPKERNISMLFAGVALLAGILLIYKMYPIHLHSGIGYGQDPAYQYLFAGIDILQGNAPHHTDHPGTPLQSLIAGTIAVVWFLSKLAGITTLGIFDSVLADPELYLLSVTCVLLMLSCSAIYYCGLKVFRATGNYSLAISLQLSPFLFEPVIPNFIYPTPEALLITVVMTLIGVMTPVLFGPSEIKESACSKAALPAGIICGIGLATKITFFPILAILLLLKRPTQILKGVMGAVIGWTLGVLPIFERLPRMFEWFKQVLTHSGTHGGGSTEVFNFEQFLMAINWLIRSVPFFYFISFCLFTTLLINICLIILRPLNSLPKNRYYPSTWSFDQSTPIVLLIVVILQTVMVAKHPGLSYMVPALPFALVGGIWLINNSNIFIKSIKLKKWTSNLYLVLILSLAITAFISAYQRLDNIDKEAQKSHAEISNEIKKYNNPLLIGAFNCNFLACAEWFGMLLVPDMELRMVPFTPNFYHYDVFNKRLHAPGIGVLDNEQVKNIVNDLSLEKREILLISPEYEQLKIFNLEKIYSTKIQNLYKVTGIRNDGLK